MNRTLFWRLAWKEYRMLRGFWIALASFTVVAQLIAVVTFTLLNHWTNEVPSILFGWGFGFAAFFALACGATLFAVEREEETYEFLRTLPVSGGQAMLAKFAVAVASIVAFWAFVYLESTLVCGLRWPELSVHGFLWGTLGLAAVEALAWGVFFSLVLARPMTAVFSAAAAVIVTVGTIVWWVDYHPPFVTNIGKLPEVIVERLIVLVAVMAADVWLARRWFDETLFLPADALRLRLARRRTQQQRDASLTAGVARPEERRAWRRWLHSQRTPIARLLWQQWRQSRLTMALMTGVGAAMVAWSAISVYPTLDHRATRFAAGAAAGVTVVLTALAGASAFQPDQSKQSFRFLAERGVRPATIWFARHLVWLVPIALWTTATLVLWLAITHRDLYEIVQELMKDEAAIEDSVAQSQHVMRILAGMSLVVVALAYAAGQFCSMFLRRGVVAWFFSLLLTGVLWWWAGLMDLLGINWLWSVAPIPLVLLVATWLRTPLWLLERTDRPARWQAALSVALPAMALVVAVIAFRVYQIPSVDPGFSVADFERPITPEERATAEMYLKAAGMITFPAVEPSAVETVEVKQAQEAALVAANGPAIALALEATARPRCSFFDRSLTDYNLLGLVALGRLLVNSAHVLEDQGQLDAAWERYVAALQLSRRLRPDEIIANRLEELVDERVPYWAARTGQTPERIRRAIHDLQDYYVTLPPATDGIKTKYVMATRILNLDPELWNSTPQELRMLRIGTALVPWEMARSRRAVNLITASELETTDRVQAAVDNGMVYSDVVFSDLVDQLPKRLWETTLFASSTGQDIQTWSVASDLISIETRRRATLILLALVGSKAEHGELPKTLDDLVGVYFDKLPLDPYSGRPFRYLPNGLPEGAWFDGDLRWAAMRPGDALIWSTGPLVRISSVDTDGPKYLVIGRTVDWEPPSSERSVWFGGIPFPIP